jgi:hypothetical protein
VANELLHHIRDRKKEKKRQERTRNKIAPKDPPTVTYFHLVKFPDPPTIALPVRNLSL